MTAPQPARVSCLLVQAKAPDLRELLERHMVTGFGETRVISALDRRRSAYSSSCPVDELDVSFSGGSMLRLVLKDLSPAATLAEARRARPAFLYNPRREFDAYRWVTPHAPPGTATWYGEVLEPHLQRYWLLLERVEGLRLTEVGAFSTWERAAKWLALLHQSFPAPVVERVRRESRLLVYDEEFYWCWLERARRFVKRDRVARGRLDQVARGYRAVVKRLVSLPRTIIHGDFYADNVLVRRDGNHIRICPVDWELAACAPGLIDLASLTAGWGEQEQRALGRAYRAARRVGPSRSRRSDRHDFFADLNCCQLHLAVKMIGWSADWTPPPQHARDWLADAVRISDRLQA